MNNDGFNIPLVTRREVSILFYAYWEAYIGWLRAYMIDMITQSGNSLFLLQRLVDNDRAFTDRMMEVYGYEPAREVERLLLHRIIIMHDLLEKMLAGDERTVLANSVVWQLYSNMIAAQMTLINQFWSKAALESISNEQLAAMIEEMNYRMARGGAVDEPDYARSDIFAREAADYLAGGYIRQFGIV